MKSIKRRRLWPFVLLGQHVPLPVPIQDELGVRVEVDVALMGGGLGVVVEALDVGHEALARGRERLVLDGVAREELAARFGEDGDALVEREGSQVARVGVELKYLIKYELRVGARAVRARRLAPSPAASFWSAWYVSSTLPVSHENLRPPCESSSTSTESAATMRPLSRSRTTKSMSGRRKVVVSQSSCPRLRLRSFRPPPSTSTSSKSEPRTLREVVAHLGYDSVAVGVDDEQLELVEHDVLDFLPLGTGVLPLLRLLGKVPFARRLQPVSRPW